MKNSYFNYFKPSVLIAFISTLAIALYLAKDHWELSIKVSGTITILLILISKYLWKYKPFVWMFWVDDFSGRYEGTLQYQYNDEKGLTKKGELKQVKLINQNGNRITISSFTIKQDGARSSLSVSKGMFVERTEDEQHYRFIYNYLNDGSIDQKFPPHYGTEIIKFLRKGDDKFLSGNYYTGREPFQTKGELVDFKWISNNLEHEF
ncbi:Cap15 family cyclic dinucleotide receptor domain-containing protein [Labilibaculum euxinus]